MGESHPSRGAWIEISRRTTPPPRDGGRTPHGVRGLKYERDICRGHEGESHPSRGAWIEIPIMNFAQQTKRVAPLTGCVD